MDYDCDYNLIHDILISIKFKLEFTVYISIHFNQSTNK